MAEIKPKKVEPQKSMLTSLLRPGTKFLYKRYIKNHPMYKDTIKAFKKGIISKIQKNESILGGLRSFANQSYKAFRKISKDPKLEKGHRTWARENMGELGKTIVKLKQSKKVRIAQEVADKLKGRGYKPNYKGGLMRKPKLARKGF
jgi:hypothetical protein